ncbi:uncharacterized protein LOC128805774 isoform X1 [Vidua macroura]|uniref:uncharacterized protein LOC128805774 isoform X1 n=2 Tax=Vidua macroura TaxID=187451 RepID=UPI0023A88C29|nr:uncharacterized protein LOC128805774 isoform X1 [Vidua macroura]XP_053830647.1 uncharacterized protein LOC128805774 isoform X1 [Vidua macroura]
MLSIPCQEGAEVQGEGKKVFQTSPPRAMNIWLLLSALVYLRRCLSTSTREQGSSKTHIFYAVEIDGDSNTASFLAKQHGMQFISKVKWVNIRQLIIETCMLHSQSRMTEQVMDDLKQDFSYRTCFGQGAVFLSVLQALVPVRWYMDSQWIGVMDVKGDINQAVVKDLIPALVNGDKCHPESAPLWDRKPTERSPENMPRHFIFNPHTYKEMKNEPCPKLLLQHPVAKIKCELGTRSL